MRRLTWLSLLLAVLISLAACAPTVAGPTAAPTAAPATEAATTVATMVATTVATAASTSPAAQPTAANQAAGPGVDLASGAWKWTQGTTAAGTVQTVSDPSKFRVQFDPSSGQVSIATACNSATGNYTTNGRALKIILTSMTNAVCPGDTLSPLFITELGAVQSYTINQGSLVLSLAANAGTLTLTH
jgi:heat shock protein HslJ